jgi:RNA polymerase sigma-70 factor (ECF subfamily)
MDLGSDVSVPLAGTRLSVWSLPAKTEKKSALTVEIGSHKVSFDELYQQYYERVLAYMRFRTGSPDAAEDLVAQVFERAVSHLDDLQSPGAVGAWLFRIARNCAADYFRRYRVMVSLDTLVDGNHPRECSPEEELVAREERMLLLTQLNRLSEREREVIGLKFVACLQNREIARVLHMPEGTVGSLLHRALSRLRDALHDEGGNE